MARERNSQCSVNTEGFLKATLSLKQHWTIERAAFAHLADARLPPAETEPGLDTQLSREALGIFSTFLSL